MRTLALILLVLAAAVLVWPSGRVRSELLGLRPLASSRIEGDAYPRVLVDPVGRRMEIPAKPRRVVSMILSGDEILADLGVLDRVKGLTYFAADPVSSNCAGKVPKELAFVDDNLEQVLSLEPDLLLVAGYTEAGFTRTLAAAGIPLLYLGGYYSFADIQENIRLIAAAVGEPERGRELAGNMERRIAAVEERVRGLSRPRVLFLMEGTGTHGRHTSVDAVIGAAGGINIASTEAGVEGMQRLSLEAAIALDPEVILVTRYTGGPDESVTDRYLKSRDWQDVQAVKTRRVYSVPDRSLINVSHYLADGVEQVARALHPEAFGS